MLGPSHFEFQHPFYILCFFDSIVILLLLQMSTGEQFTVSDFVGNRADYPVCVPDVEKAHSLRIGKTVSLTKLCFYGKCLNELCFFLTHLRRVELLTRGMIPECFAPEMRALLSRNTCAFVSNAACFN
jgi:hypothetical protein